MRYLSVCSGIEAATVAWAPLGWSPMADDADRIDQDELPSAIIMTATKAVDKYDMLVDFSAATKEGLYGG